MKKIILTSLLGFSLYVGLASAQTNADAIGWVTSKSGDVSFISKGETQSQPLRLSQAVYLGQTISTASRSAARVLLKGDNVITISENSKLTLTQYLVTPQKTVSSFDLVVGRIRAAVSSRLLAQRGDFFEIRTRNAVAGVRGSQLGVTYDPDANQTAAGCGAGDCYMTVGNQTVSIPVGQLLAVVGNNFGQPQALGQGQPGSYDPNQSFDNDGRSGEGEIPGGGRTGENSGFDEKNQNLDKNRAPKAPHDPFSLNPDRYFRFIQNLINTQRQVGSGANIGNEGGPTGGGTTRGPGE